MDSNAIGDDLDPRMGWIESFVAVARHCSYEFAAVELGINASNAERNVESLERWLHRILVIGGKPLELDVTDDIQFLPVALECLERLSAHAKGRGNGSGSPVLRKSKVSGIRLSDLNAFVQTVRCGNYAAAAYEMGCSHYQVRRNITKIEGVTGKLLAGRSIMQATQAGIAFLGTAEWILDALAGSRAVIPLDYDPDKERLRRIAERVDSDRVRLRNFIILVQTRASLSKKDRMEIDAGLIRLDKLDRLARELAGMVEKRDTSAADIDVRAATSRTM